MEVLKVIEEFQLHILPCEWYENVWNSNFSGEKVMPEVYRLHFQNADFLSLLTNLRIAINNWKEDTSGNLQSTSNTSYQLLNEKSWNTLMRNNVNYKALVSLTSIFIDRTLDDKDKINLALAASRAYFALLSIPGSMICDIFNPLLYDQVIDIYATLMSLFPKDNPLPKKRLFGRDVVQGDDSNSTEKLSVEEQQEMFSEICLMLDDFSSCVDIIGLVNYECSLAQTTKLLAKFTLFEYNFPKFCTTDAIVSKSYNILVQFCIPQHGELDCVIKCILSAYLCHLIINEENVKIEGDVSKNKSVLEFIKRLIDIFKKDALASALPLVQKLCRYLPDKADIRAKAISQIIYLLKQFPYDEFEIIMKWVVSLAHSESSKHRLCAIEVIYEVLNVAEFCESSTNETIDRTEMLDISVNYGGENSGNHNQIQLLYKFLIGAIFSRSLDISPMVRSRSLTTLALLVLSKHDDIKNIIHELFVSPYEEFIPAETGNNESFFNYQIYFSSDHTSLPENPLPSGLCIMHKIGYLAKDSKVYVRKNALQVLSNVLMLNKNWISEERLMVCIIYLFYYCS